MKRLNDVEILQQLKRLIAKYQTPFGLAVWGFTAPGEAKEVLVDSEGRLQVSGEFTGTVEVPNIDVLLSTRASETTLSSVLAQLDITLSALRDALRGASTKDFTTLEADVESIDAKVATESTLNSIDTKVATESTLSSIRSQLDIALSELKATDVQTPRTLSELYDELSSIDAKDFATETTLLSILAKLDIALSEIKASGVETPRTLSNLYDQLVSILGQLDVALSTRASESTLSGIKTQTDKLTFEAGTGKLLVKSTRDWTITETVTISPDPRDRNWNLGASDVPDLSDRAGRLLGIVYGSQGQQLLQRATTYDLLVQLRHGGAEIDPRDRNWTITETVSVSGSVTIQEPLSVDDGGGSLTVDAVNLDIRNLAKALDEVYAVLRTDAGVAYDARDRNWTITETLSIGNPPNLDVALSTRSSESTLSSFSGKFPSAVALGDALSNPTTTLLGAALLGWDPGGTVWERLQTDGSGVLKVRISGCIH